MGAKLRSHLSMRDATRGSTREGLYASSRLILSPSRGCSLGFGMLLTTSSARTRPSGITSQRRRRLSSRVVLDDAPARRPSVPWDYCQRHTRLVQVLLPIASKYPARSTTMSTTFGNGDHAGPQPYTDLWFSRRQHRVENGGASVPRAQEHPRA